MGRCNGSRKSLAESTVSDEETRGFVVRGMPSPSLNLLRGRVGRSALALAGAGVLAWAVVALRAPQPGEASREATVRDGPREIAVGSAVELLEVNVDVPVERQLAAAERAQAIAQLLNHKSKEEASALVQKAIQRAGNETLARRRVLKNTNQQFNDILRQSKGRCFIKSTVPDSNDGVYLTADVPTSAISLAVAEGQTQQWRIYNAGADDVYSITAIRVPVAGPFLSSNQKNLRVFMGPTGEDQSWRISPVPGQDGEFTIQAVVPGRGTFLLSHDRTGVVSLEKATGESLPRQRWSIPCQVLNEGRVRQRQATCAFNVIYATQYLARASLVIQGAARTCPDSRGLLTKICALNSLVIVASFSNLALSISNAASSCAETTNVHALCASGVEALVVSLSTLGAGGLVTAVGCQPGLTVADLHLPPGASAANPGGPIYVTPHRRQVRGQGRRLFLGGGHDNFLAQCVLDFTQVAWSLGSIGIAITAAVRDSCPPSGTGLLFQLTQSACAMDIGAVLYAFGRIAVFLALASIHCLNDLNLQALCAAGVSAIVAAAAALVVTGNAFFIACDKGISTVEQGGLVPANVGSAAEAGATRRLAVAKTLAATANRADLHKLVEGYGFNISNPMRLPNFDNIDSALKVLESFDELQAEQLGVGKASLAKRFKNPEDMWQQMGIDASGTKIPAAPPAGHENERFVKLMEPVLSKEDLEAIVAV